MRLRSPGDMLQPGRGGWMDREGGRTRGGGGGSEGWRHHQYKLTVILLAAEMAACQRAAVNQFEV